jgi:hypothetical protein
VSPCLGRSRKRGADTDPSDVGIGKDRPLLPRRHRQRPQAKKIWVIKVDQQHLFKPKGAAVGHP